MRSFLGQKKAPYFEHKIFFRKCGRFGQKKQKKKLAAVGLEPGISVSLTTTLPTTPSRHSLIIGLKIAYIKKLKLFFSRYEKNYKIRFVGNTDATNWVKFGHHVTSIFVKNYQKLKKNNFFVSSVIAEEKRNPFF